MKTHVKIVLIFIFSLLLVACETSQTAQEVIDRFEITFSEGDSYTFVTTDVLLPGLLLDDNGSLSWTSSHPNIIDDLGRVTRPNEDTTVTLSVILSINSEVVTRDFYLTVKGLYPPLKVRFRVMGSTFQLLEIPYGERVDSFDNPYIEGFEFLGWYLSPELIEPFNFETSITEDLVIEGKFEMLTEGSITIHYFFENIANNDYTKDDTKTNTQTYNVGTLIVVDDRFTGFTLNEDLSTTTTSVSAGINKVLDVYYDRNRYSIDFINEGISEGQIDVKHGTVLTEPEDLFREGYVFEGWSTTAIGRVPYLFGQEITQDMTLYAIWISDDPFTYEGYYEGATGLSGYSLTAFLRNAVNTGFTPVDYGSSRYILDETDRDPNDSSKVVLVYLGTVVSGTWDGGITWNREHVWPQSLLGVSVENNSVNQGSDLHNLKPANPAENSSRSNKYFDISTDFDSYLPRAAVRGDIARILFYMATAYDFLSLVNHTPVTYQMAMLNVLLKWHEDDPVDDFEMNRNNVIFHYQGNRNPFIDHPEFAEKIWGVSPLNSSDNVPFYVHFETIPFTIYAINTTIYEKKDWINKA